jgi:hypothetical protein
MKIMSVPCSSPSFEPELLIRFVLKRLSEIESDQIEPPPVLLALILAAGSHVRAFHDPLKGHIISSSDKADEILGTCSDLFMPALGRTDDGPDDEKPFPDKEICQRVLQYALVEGRRILAEKDFEFSKIFQFLGRTGLFLYSFRLWQFESGCASFKDDPENLVSKGVEIIEDALGSPRNVN